LTQAKKTIASGISEAEAIDRAKRGDAESFEGLYGLHKRRVYSLCLRMTGNTAEAEDLTQEAFLQVFRRVGTFRGNAAFSTWLYRATVNTVLMNLRGRKTPPLLSLDAPLSSESPSLRRDFGKRDPQLSGAIERIALRRAIQELPEGCRMILALREVEGYRHREIAELLHCSIGNSRSQLHKAKLKMCDLLSKRRSRLRNSSSRQHHVFMQKALTGASAASYMRSMTSTKPLSATDVTARQADHERRELHAARERCWRESHQWWDEHEHRWRHERDWDEHDHDHD